MNKDHVKGAVNNAKGTVKENVGHLAGDNKLEAEGIVDRVKGVVQKGFGEAKDAVKEGVDSLLHKASEKLDRHSH